VAGKLCGCHQAQHFLTSTTVLADDGHNTNTGVLITFYIVKYVNIHQNAVLTSGKTLLLLGQSIVFGSPVS
jgi:hypothetical protein